MKKAVIFTVVLVVLGVLAFNTFFVVDEGCQAIVTRFGKPVSDRVYGPGLHVMAPFIDLVHTFESRILKWDGDPNQIPTKEKKYIWVDAIARWKITNPLTFYRTVATIRGAQSRLDDIIDSAVRDVVSENYLVDIVRGPNYKEDGPYDIDANKPLGDAGRSREKILADILTKAKANTHEYGIELIDVQIKRLNYINKVLEKVYERMISERNKVAAQYRSEGEGTKAEILGEMEKELKKIRSEAVKKAEEIKGQADAKAASIYAEAYSKDAPFYNFYRSMAALERSVNRDAKVIISTDSELFRYLKRK